MQEFVVNRHHRICFPSNFVPELDLSVMQSFEQLDSVIRRDFEVKAPTGTDILHRVEEGVYTSRYELMRDLALNLFWTNRFAITMYEKRPTRWADVPRTRTDVFLPILTPWEDGDRKIAAVQRSYATLPPSWDREVEDRIFGILFDVFGHRKHHATDLPMIKPTVAEMLADPANLTFRLPNYDADFPTYSFTDIVDCSEEVPELEALSRWAMVLHNQYPWDRSQAELVEVGKLSDDDYVVVFHPRDQEVRHFMTRLGSRPAGPSGSGSPQKQAAQPIRPYPPVNVRSHFTVMPRIEALAVVHGDVVCSNEDLIRNAAYNWSPMSADEIREKTGIEQRRYTSHSLEEIALRASQAALDHAGRGPEEIGAVLVCTCTSTRMIPSVATWISGQLGSSRPMPPRHRGGVCRVGLWPLRRDPDPAGGGASRPSRLRGEVLRQDRQCPAFPDDLRRRRRRHRRRPRPRGRGTGHRVPADLCQRPGERGELHHLAQSRLRQQHHGLRSGGEVTRRPLPRADDRRAQGAPRPGRREGLFAGEHRPDRAAPGQQDDGGRACACGGPLLGQPVLQHREGRQRLFRASIPLAIHDAVRDGVIRRPMRIFTPGFGAGAVAGYAVLRIDPAVVALASDPPIGNGASFSEGTEPRPSRPPTT